MMVDENSQIDIGIGKDDVFGSGYLGRVDRLTNDSLRAVLHSGRTGLAPTNKELLGPVFFTRPHLNLSSDNIRPRPNLFPLLTTNENSIERYVRCMLDPRLMEPTTSIELPRPALRCNLLNNKCAFMPTFSNDLITLSGFPDKIVPSYASKPGILKQVYAHADGAIEIYDDRDIDVVVRNTRGSPSYSIIDTMCEYICEAYMGRVMPYPDFSVENEIDYMIRIYVTMLKQDGVTVSRMACTGVSFPIASPTGTFFNRSGSDPYSSSPREHNFRFKSLGIIYNTNMIKRDFNDLVCIFNESMYTHSRDNDMTKIPVVLYKYFKGVGTYPRINDSTNRMEWFVENKIFDIILKRAATLAARYKKDK